mmetsp:Transcript_111189/g.346546  ORF Transcript_111189/g.346546 Transcript_111189/m.346546 type:complete len:242 (-) Transcript_111189:480-1205(-)
MHVRVVGQPRGLLGVVPREGDLAEQVQGVHHELGVAQLTKYLLRLGHGPLCLLKLAAPQANRPLDEPGHALSSAVSQLLEEARRLRRGEQRCVEVLPGRVRADEDLEAHQRLPAAVLQLLEVQQRALRGPEALGLAAVFEVQPGHLCEQCGLKSRVPQLPGERQGVLQAPQRLVKLARGGVAMSQGFQCCRLSSAVRCRARSRQSLLRHEQRLVLVAIQDVRLDNGHQRRGLLPLAFGSLA